MEFVSNLTRYAKNGQQYPKWFFAVSEILSKLREKFIFALRLKPKLKTETRFARSFLGVPVPNLWTVEPKDSQGNEMIMTVHLYQMDSSKDVQEYLECRLKCLFSSCCYRWSACLSQRGYDSPVRFKSTSVLGLGSVLFNFVQDFPGLSLSLRQLTASHPSSLVPFFGPVSLDTIFSKLFRSCLGDVGCLL